jgi:hypothetical protein
MTPAVVTDSQEINLDIENQITMTILIARY